ncbi:YicC family protein [Candidatus Bipolaricaulota bacterium]|nr:YicC family protein [Candidatus Bipolaricaulota bacterium]
MARSMTGFGSANGSGDGWSCEVTVRSVNHRFLAVRTKGLNDWPAIQVQLEEAVKARFSRGDVAVWVKVERNTGEAGLQFDLERATQYLKALQHAATVLSLPSQPTIRDLVDSGSLSPVENEELPWPLIQATLDDALDRTEMARGIEGAALAENIEQLLGQLSEALAEIRERIPEVMIQLRQRLTERVAALGVEVDQQRIDTEIVLLAERFDVEEEVTRLAAHIQRGCSLLEAEGPTGKELDFLSQEILREVNTLGAKSRDLTIHERVVEMKVAIERMREQVQNVE